ncbi:MAG: hypothetical protein Q9227_005153 [Pyrenula ochraceoflavens]
MEENLSRKSLALAADKGLENGASLSVRSSLGLEATCAGTPLSDTSLSSHTAYEDDYALSRISDSQADDSYEPSLSFLEDQELSTIDHAEYIPLQDPLTSCSTVTTSLSDHLLTGIYTDFASYFVWGSGLLEVIDVEAMQAGFPGFGTHTTESQASALDSELSNGVADLRSPPDRSLMSYPQPLGAESSFYVNPPPSEGGNELPHTQGAYYQTPNYAQSNAYAPANNWIPESYYHSPGIPYTQASEPNFYSSYQATYTSNPGSATQRPSLTSSYPSAYDTTTYPTSYQISHPHRPSNSSIKSPPSHTLAQDITTTTPSSPSQSSSSPTTSSRAASNSPRQSPPNTHHSHHSHHPATSTPSASTHRTNSSSSSSLSPYGLPVPGAPPNSWRCAFPHCTSRTIFTRGCDLRKHYHRHEKRFYCRHAGCPSSQPDPHPHPHPHPLPGHHHHHHHSDQSAAAAAAAGLTGGKGFSSKKDRARHEAKHNPQVRCTWVWRNARGEEERCGKVFSRVDNMQDHVKRIHRKGMGMGMGGGEGGKR